MITSEALDVRPVLRLFKALADETRLRIVALLSHGELCVCHIQEALGLSQSNISRQLAILRAAEIVRDKRCGMWVSYQLLPLDDPDAQRYLRGVVQDFAKDQGLKRDLSKLQRTCGPRA